MPNTPPGDAISWATHSVWPGTPPASIRVIFPLGSRHDCLLLNLATARVATGRRPTDPLRACFEGTVDEFEAKVKQNYGRPYGEQEKYYREYTAAIAFLRAIMHQDRGASEAGLP